LLSQFITSYTTPHGTSLPRHLSTSALSPQLTHLKLSRPFSITQSNSIRWLKNLIATIDPSAPEPAAKQYIITSISTFVRERFTIADRVIAQIAGERIRDGEVILTYAKSAVVTQTLLSAYTAGKKFRVVVVDSRPLFEGKALARTLSAAGIAVSYVFTSGLTHALQDVTLCILGAHAVLGNGGVYSRVGTALVGMAAKHRGVPVCVLAESVKFTERVMLDSVVGNELAGEEEMMFDVLPQSSTMPPQVSAVVASGKGDTKGAAGKSSKLPAQKDEPLKDYDVEKRHPVAGLMKDWRERENLYVLNIMYDVMPPEHVDAIITEHGTLPPGCAPIVGRMNIGG
jgi:translation initiation factor eIF-2B subunit delta